MTMTIEDIQNDAEFINPSDKKKRKLIKVIGVGGGGNNAINHMYSEKIEGVSFVVCNTDLQALNNSPVPSRILIGPNTTFGLGAGNNPEVARAAAEESADQIKELFDKETQMVFITAGMGGGTGTGAAPVVARIAKECGKLTIGIVTIPFLFEGKKKILKALDGADEMSKYVDAMLVINNERLKEVYGDLNFINAFKKADDTLSTAARSISEIITIEGHINLDFKDVETTLKDGGSAIISTGYGEGEDRVNKAIEAALTSPLLRNRDILTSKRLLFNLYFSDAEDVEFKTSEIEALDEFVSDIEDVDVIWGVSFDKTLGDKVKITILASGFEISDRKEIMDVATRRAKKPVSGVLNFDQQPNQSQKSDVENQRLTKEYGEKYREMQTDKARARYVVLQPNQYDNDSIIEKFESIPAYNRDKAVADAIRSGIAAEEVKQEDVIAETPCVISEESESTESVNNDDITENDESVIVF